MVHYPLMRHMAPDRFIAFEKEHCDRIGRVVAPAMLLEGGLGVWICYQVHLQQLGGWAILASWVGLVLLGCIWFSTFGIQVPIHNRLSQGFNMDQIDTLVRTNWIRTVAWTLRAALAGYLIWVHQTSSLVWVPS